MLAFYVDVEECFSVEGWIPIECQFLMNLMGNQNLLNSPEFSIWKIPADFREAPYYTILTY
jgi:hypothetical protein